MSVSQKASRFCVGAAGAERQAPSGHGGGAARPGSGFGAAPQILLAHSLCLALILFPAGAGPLFGQSADVARCFTPIDWVVLIDTSQSMEGKGKGAKKIFPRVKEVLHQFVPTIRDADTLTLFTFDTTSNRLVSVDGVHRGEALARIDGLSAPGLSTNVGAATRDALAEAYSRNDKRRLAVILLLSDGHEDLDRVPADLRFPMSQTLALVRASDVPYFFYASLGQDPDTDLKKLIAVIAGKATGHAAAFNDPGATRLIEETAKVRETVCPPAHLSIKLQGHKIQGAAASIDLGSLTPGETSAPYTIDIASDVPTPLNVDERDLPPGLGVGGLPDGLINVGPQQYERLRFTVAVPNDATDGAYDFPLLVQPTGSDAVSIAVHYSVAPTLAERLRRAREWSLRNWYWLALLPLLIVAIRRGLNPPPTPLPGAELELPGVREPLKLDKDVELPRGSPTLKISRDGDSHKIRALSGTTLKIDRPSAPKPFELGANDFRLSSGDMISSPSYRGPLRYHNGGRLIGLK
ncbi:MAG TPA: vWA domain-containing protein [Bryobacteraceae bacterium]|jgi:hypothetical protein|nr:vWA domain-containing protein [Bryobacteraceae bacterium]